MLKMKSFDSINPATGEKISSYPLLTDAQLDQTLHQSQQAFPVWRDMGFAARGALLLKLAQLLRARSDEYSHLMALEMGKPVTQGKAEIEKCAWACEYFAINAESFLQDEMIVTEAQKSYTNYQPLGTVLAIMPWNYPFWQVFRCGVPILMAGNTLLFKHAPNTTGCGLAIEKLFADAGFPAGVVQALVIDENQAGQVIDDARVMGVTLTGSERAGRVVAARAGAALKKCVLELGGSDPWVILDDADVEDAAAQAVHSRLTNAGQVCIAAKRLIVVESVLEKFTTRVLQELQKYQPSDPLKNDAVLGPLARHDLRQNIARQVSVSKAQGANCVMGGVILDGSGFFYPATLLTHVRPDNIAFQEELFGPVVAITSAKDEVDAISLANQSRYGLGAVVFTRDVQRGEKMARDELQAGACFVNAAVRSDPRLPFGGIKNSGFGRELGVHGLREFANVKTVWVK